MPAESPSPSESVLTVTQLTYRIKNVIERNMNEVWVEGEISNFVHHGSGYMYFSLKDRDAQIRCAMFKGKNRSLRFRPSNGALVRARGTIGVWPPQGTYQLYVDQMLPSGVGALHQAFEELKIRLHREGLFDPRHKKPIPKFPRRIGVVTSPTGAAIRDIVNVISRRYPLTELVLCPARVQGDGAAFEISRAIRTFDTMTGPERPDVLIVGRGGGSIEDLWPFNEEITARAVFACSIPVIAAVGHEIDTTITDFVADFRAPTPSAGAEAGVPDMMELRAELTHREQRMIRMMTGLLQTGRLRLDRLAESPAFKPRIVIREMQMNLDRSMDMLVAGLKDQTYTTRSRLNRLNAAFIAHQPGGSVRRLHAELDRLGSRWNLAWKDRIHDETRRLEALRREMSAFSLEKFRHALIVIAAELKGHDPRAILRKGYAICSRRDGTIVTAVRDAPAGTALDVEIGDGILECDVTGGRRTHES